MSELVEETNQYVKKVEKLIEKYKKRSVGGEPPGLNRRLEELPQEIMSTVMNPIVHGLANLMACGYITEEERKRADRELEHRLPIGFVKDKIKEKLNASSKPVLYKQLEKEASKSGYVSRAIFFRAVAELRHDGVIKEVSIDKRDAYEIVKPSLGAPLSSSKEPLKASEKIQPVC
jgi:hypothetical protein